MKNVQFRYLVVTLVFIGVSFLIKVAAENLTYNIWKAAATGDIEFIEAYLAEGHDINAKDPEFGSTALITSATYGRIEVAKFLIDKGANLSEQKNDGNTALHDAAFFCRMEIVELLLDKGADTTIENFYEDIPLGTVSGPWSAELEGYYHFLSDMLKIPLDIELLKTERSNVMVILQDDDKGLEN